MPFNPSTGVYTPPVAYFPAISGTLILAADYNAVVNDIASALSVTFLRDGSLPMTANLKMGGYKITGLSLGTAGAPAIPFGTNDGPFSTGAGDYSISVGGVRVGWWNANGYAGKIHGPTYTGTQDFTGAASVRVPEPALSDSAARLVDVQSMAGGGFGYPWTVVSAHTNCVASYGYAVRSDLGAYTMTLPASPTANTLILFTDVGGNSNVNNITIARNGKTIMGLSEDLICNTAGATFALQYINNDWRLV